MGTRGTLDGLIVVDLSRALAGPHATMMLGDLGARVIKVENPGSGDDTRSWGPPFVGPDNAQESTYFLSCNRDKESITLDLKNDEGRALLRSLIERADVLVENFRPGTLDRLGFDPETLGALNPRLIVLSISGFGHDGPEKARAGYDQIAQGEAGLMSLTGSGPDDVQRAGVPIGDLLAGMYGAYGVLAALHERSITGKGQVVRTSLLAAIVGVHAFQGSRWTVAQDLPRAQGNHHPSIAPYGLFHTVDGPIQLAVGSEALWRSLCEVLSIDPETPGYATNSERVTSREKLIALIEDAMGDEPSAELLARLATAGVPAGVVRTIDEVYAWEQTRSQGLVIDVDHPVLGNIELPGPPLRFFDPDGTERTRTHHNPPPTLGQHNDTIRRWLGESADS